MKPSNQQEKSKFFYLKAIFDIGWVVIGQWFYEQSL